MGKRRATVPNGVIAAFAAAALVAAADTPARADEITVAGTVLRGSVAAVLPSAIEFQTAYGKGKITVALADLEAITTDAPFHFFHGDDQETHGRIVGIEAGKLLVGDTAETAVSVDPATLHVAYSDGKFNQTGLALLRRNLALWRGNFDVGFALTQSTTDTSALALGLAADRRKKPSRVTLGAGYRYGTQKEQSQGRSTLENEVKGLLRGEYDVSTHWFTFAQGDAEYDEIERLSLRGIPKGGVGYRFWETETGLLQVEGGGAYTYERFFGGDTNQFFAIAFGKLLEWQLPWYGTEINWKTEYLPAVDDWARDYLLRSQAALLVPMLDYLKLKLTAAEQYDSTPAEDAENNTLTLTAGLSLVF
jgi:putative salt-induced outer membrane protein YdiY